MRASATVRTGLRSKSGKRRMESLVQIPEFWAGRRRSGEFSLFWPQGLSHCRSRSRSRRSQGGRTHQVYGAGL